MRALKLFTSVYICLTKYSSLHIVYMHTVFHAVIIEVMLSTLG